MATWLFLFLSLFSAFSPIGASTDSVWTVDIATSLWRHGSTNLDDFADRMNGDGFYAAMCVSPEGALSDSRQKNCRGHLYNWFPVGGPILTAPLVLATVGVGRILGPARFGFPVYGENLRIFLAGDADRAHGFIEKIDASLILGATSVVVFFIASLFLNVRRAAMLTLIFGLATSAYSIAGRALWQHTPSMFLLSVIILMLLKAEKRPALAAWAGIPVALSYTVRPTDSLFVAIFTIYVAVRHRACLVRYLLAALPIAVAFLAYNFSIYHSPFAPYYQNSLDGIYPSNWLKAAKGLAGNLVSPSRGLFVYTPVFLFSVWSMWKRMWQSALSNWLGSLAAMHAIAIGLYTYCWWAGHCYGPRFFTDLTPVFVLFLIPFFANWAQLSRYTRTAFVICVLVGLGIHLRGGWSTAVYAWNVTPANVDQFPERAWDWSDPQFLR